MYDDPTMTRFRDRREAGALLAKKMLRYAHTTDGIVVALPRGGVVVADELASALSLPLDILVVRKLGTPGQAELAMGAIARGGVRVLNDDVIRSLSISTHEIDAVAEQEEKESERREALYRDGRPPLDLKGKSVILVDDGLATGSTMFAAVEAVRTRKPGRIVVAVPVAPPDTLARLRKNVEEIVCLRSPRDFQAVGLWYDDFTQVTDREVIDILAARNGVPVG